MDNGNKIFYGEQPVDGDPSSGNYVQAYMVGDFMPVLYLDHLYVSPDNRRKGLGRAFLEVIESLAIQNSCARIEGVFHPSSDAEYEDVRKFYLNNGYMVFKNLNGICIIFKSIL